MARWCSWWLCSHDVDVHTIERGCTARVGERECLCHFTADEAAEDPRAAAEAT